MLKLVLLHDEGELRLIQNFEEELMRRKGIAPTLVATQI